MGNLTIAFDEKAAKAVGLGKAIARREGDKRLDTVHVFKAALLSFPEEVAQCVRRTGGVWTDAFWDVVIAPEGIKVEEDPMPVTAELAKIVQGLGARGESVTLEALVKAFLDAPTVRLKSVLNRAAAYRNAAGCSGKAGKVLSRAYGSRRDWLADLHVEWRLRKSAARACGFAFGFEQDDHQDSYSADNALDASIRVSMANRRKAEISPRKFDPLAPLSTELDDIQRSICEGVLVNEFYSLAFHSACGLSVRELAQMLSPETYPSNCHKVLDAVEQLEAQGVMVPADRDDVVGLTGRVRLTDEALERLLSSLEEDTISTRELNELKRRIRYEADLDGGGLKPVI